MTLGFYFIGCRLGTCDALVVGPIRIFPRRSIKPSLHLVQGTFGVFTLCQCIPEVGLLFVEKLRVATNCLGPMGRVWITLNLAERWWWLSHCRNWSMWVGFLYTVMDRIPSGSCFTMVSKKGMDPSSLLVSTVNWMAGSMLLMCCRNSCYGFPYG